MKNHIKKIISLITSAVLLFSTLAMPILAASSLDEQIALETELLSAKQNMDSAYNNLLEIQAELKTNAAFYEDFEGETQKVGYRNGSTQTKVTVDIPEENGNKYGKVTVNTGHAASGYYGVLDSSPVPVNNTDYYKVVFDYKVTGSESDKIRFYRTKAASSDGVGTSDYLNNTEGWNTFTTTTPKYSITSTVFYLQITGATPAGAEICIDNFMVVTTTEYEKLEGARTDYQKAVAAYEAAKAAYEATLSLEKIAYIKAEEAMISAETNLASVEENIKSNAAFYEDFEGETQKVGYRNGSTQTKVTVDIPEENGNKYGKVTVNTGHAASGYYGVLDSSPVPVNNTDYYKVVFDYKVTGSEIDKIRFYRTKAASSDGVGEGYLNDTDGWSTYEYTTPKYTIDSTVFYLQITGATPAGTEICIDNFMVVTTTEYEKLEGARTDYQKAIAAYEAAKAAYEASLSPEELAYINAKDAMNDAKTNLASVEENIKSNAAFYEDFEGETQKVGYRNGSTQTKVTVDIPEENGNKYGKVTVNTGHAASGYYGVLDSSPVPVNNTDYYKVVFDYKVTGSEIDKIRFYRTKAASSDGVGEGYLNDTDGWSTYEYTTPKYTIDSTVFYLQITGATPAGTEICIDNFMVVTTTDYEKLEAAKADYLKAVSDYETAKKAYEESLVPSTPEESAYKAAKADYEGTKNALILTAPFYEDYEGNTNKMGFIHNNHNKITETILEENGNHYASVLYEPEEISAKYGVDMNNGQTSNSTFTVEANTDYVLKFRYNLGDYSASGYRRVYINDTFKYELNKNGIEGSSNDVVIEFNSGDKTKAHFYTMVTGDHTTICVDDFVVLKKSDYELLNEKRRVYEQAKDIYEASINPDGDNDPDQKHLLFEHTEGELSDYFNIGSGLNAQVIVDSKNPQNHIAELTKSSVDDFSFNGNNLFSKTFKDLDIGQLYIIKFDFQLSDTSNVNAFVYGSDLHKSIIDSIHAPLGANAALVNGKIMQISAENDGWYTYMILFKATEISANFGLMPELSDSAKCCIDNIKLEKADDSLVANTGKIRNPSFELDSTFPYDVANNLVAELDTENVSDGKQSLKCIGGGRIKQEITVEPNTYYEWSFDLKFGEETSINTSNVLVQPGVPSIQSATLVGGYSSSERNASSGYGYIACGDHEFNRYTLKFYTKNTTKITLTLIFRDTNKVSYLDNMALNKVGSAAYEDYEDENTIFEIDFDDGYSTAITSKNGGSKYFGYADDGDKCLSIDATSLGKGTAINLKDKYHVSTTSNLTLENQTTYRYTFYAKTNNTASNNIAVRYVFSQTSSQYTDTKFTLGTNWQKYELYFSTTDDNVISFISFILNEPDENQMIYIDDVLLEKVDPQITSVNSEKTWIDSIANRISNGTFEKEFSDADWGTNSGLTRVVDKENALGGSAYIKIDGAVNYTRDVRVKTGRFFTFAFSYKTDAEQSDLKIGLMIDGKVMDYPIKPTVDSMIEIENTDGRWVRASYDFITPSTGYVQLVIQGTSNNVIVDEFCLFESALGLAKDVNDYTVYEENIPLIPNIIYVDSLPEDTKPDTQPENNDNNSSENNTDSDDKVQTSAPSDDDTDDDDDESDRKKKVVKKRKKKSDNNYQWIVWTASAIAAVVVSGVIVFIVLKRKKKGTGK